MNCTDQQKEELEVSQQTDVNNTVYMHVTSFNFYNFFYLCRIKTYVVILLIQLAVFVWKMVKMV